MIPCLASQAREMSAMDEVPELRIVADRVEGLLCYLSLQTQRRRRRDPERLESGLDRQDATLQAAHQPLQAVTVRGCSLNALRPIA
jgi:hypothetical protein